MSERAVDQAVEVLRAGGVVGMPTETVYGLAADARREDAVARVFALKGRPSTNPLIVHVASVEIAERYAIVDGRARRLFEAFSPGPLTIVLPKQANQICDLVTAGLQTVGIRIPDHPLALRLLRDFDGPIAAPSANQSNHISPTTAEHVREAFGSDMLVLDGGPCRVGIESTVITLCTDPPTILRPGDISQSQIEAVIGPVKRFVGHVETGVAAASPGQSVKHYAPRAAAWRFERGESWLAKAIEGVAVIACGSTLGRITESGVIVRALADDPAEAAQQIYGLLREIDTMNPKAILIEMPPDEPRWAAMRDRLSRAARPIAEWLPSADCS